MITTTLSQYATCLSSILPQDSNKMPPASFAGFFERQILKGACRKAKAQATVPAFTSKCFLCLGLVLLSVGAAAQSTQTIKRCQNYTGATAGEKITNCIASLPQTGGIADARDIEGNQVITSTVRINRPVSLLLGQVNIVSTASPAFLVHSSFHLE